MTKGDWQQLESLCRKAIDSVAPPQRNHALFDAVRTTGALAASVLAHWDEDAESESEHHAH